MICIPCLMTGGTEIQTLNLVNALAIGGHEVTTVCYFEYSHNMVQRYRQAGSKVICLNRAGTRVRGWMGVCFLLKNLKRVLRVELPDIVHVQYMAPGAIPILLLRLLGMKNIITTVHTSADIYPSLGLIHFIQKYCVRAFTCITERAEQGFFGCSRLYTPDFVLQQRNHFTIYNALPYGMKFSNPKRRERPTVIGVVSRLEEIKGMVLVVPAFAKVKEKHADARLIVVGDGSLKDAMLKQAKDLGVEDLIEWTGRQSQEYLHEWYGKMDIVLMPSRSEGFGLTAIEAMANGCVVVASNTGGLPEVIKDGEVGLLHKVEDVTDMVAKMNLLFDDNELYKKIQGCVRSYVERYSFEKFSESINSLYSKL